MLDIGKTANAVLLLACSLLPSLLLPPSQPENIMGTKFSASVLFALAAGAAQAADVPPVATVTSSTVAGLSFAAYSGSTVVGDGLINDSKTLYFIEEHSGPLGTSWYILYEPKHAESLTATITFSSAITGIYTDQLGLISSGVGVESPSVSYDYSNSFVGLESRTDQASFSGKVLTISFTSKDPGDHLRVFTSAVPETGTAALMAAGLMAGGFAVMRRRGARRKPLAITPAA